MEEGKGAYPLPDNSWTIAPERWSFLLKLIIAVFKFTKAVRKASIAAIIVMTSISFTPFPPGVRQLYHKWNMCSI